MDTLLITGFVGAVVGSLYALYGFGLVLTYRTTGIYNFAQGAIGTFLAFIYFQLVEGGSLNLAVAKFDDGLRLPSWAAMAVVVLVVAPGLGWALDRLLFRALREAGSIVQIVATVGLFIAFEGAAGVIWSANTSLTPANLFGGGSFQIGGFHASNQELLSLLCVVALCAAVGLFLRYALIGAKMRAVVDAPSLAQLSGIRPDRISGATWALSTSFAALATILVAQSYGFLDITTLSLLVVPATAAAVIGRLQSLVGTLCGAIFIGITEQALLTYAPNTGALLAPSVPFIVLLLVFVLPIKWPQPIYGVSPRKVLKRSQASLRTHAVKVAAVAAFCLVPPLLLPGVMNSIVGPGWDLQLAMLPGLALILLSLVVLTGFGGQVSLGQAALAGVGAFVTAHLTIDYHLPILLAILGGALCTVPLGAVLAARATRLPPLFLALATLAFASFMDALPFSSQSFANGATGYQLLPPSFLQSSRLYYVFGLGVFAVCAFLVRNVGRSRTGLSLAALRDDDVAIESLGASSASLKRLVFYVSAFLAGLGGGVLVVGSGTAINTQFVTQESLIVLVLAVIGGIDSWTGALLGSGLAVVLSAILNRPFFTTNSVMNVLFHGQLVPLLTVAFGLGAIGLARNPHGVIEQNRELLGQMLARARRGFRAAGSSGEAVAPSRSEPRTGLGGTTDEEVVVLAAPGIFHRSSCLLVRGKESSPVLTAPPLLPCPVCHPDVSART